MNSLSKSGEGAGVALQPSVMNSLPKSVDFTGQHFQAGTPSEGYNQHHDVGDGLSSNSSIELNESRVQVTDDPVDEKTGPHYLIDLRTVPTNFLYQFCIKSDGNGVFRCDLGKCITGRNSGPFFKTGDVDKHIRDEIKARPFVCGFDTCKEMFKNKMDCERHVRSKNNPVSYECQYCVAKFGRKDVWNRHTAESHQENGNNSPDDQRHSKARLNLKTSTERLRPYNGTTN